MFLWRDEFPGGRSAKRERRAVGASAAGCETPPVWSRERARQASKNKNSLLATTTVSIRSIGMFDRAQRRRPASQRRGREDGGVAGELEWFGRGAAEGD